MKYALEHLLDYSNLRIFGYPAYYHVSEGKLNATAKKGIFLGYDDGVKGYNIEFVLLILN